MTTNRFKRVEELFLAATALDPAAREGFLAGECAGDDGLRAEVDELLAHDDRPAGFFRTVDFDAGRALGEHLRDPDIIEMPLRIGSYRPLRVLGEGGFGIVYLAEQESPRRTVALKLIRPGLTSRSALRRFKYEAEVLGRLHHPCIAQVHEAGTTDVEIGVWERAAPPAGESPEDVDGRDREIPGTAPSQIRKERQAFVAMEYIAGRSLTRYAKESHLSVRDRLALIARVCDGVQHAHQKGIIHRDLKPANILVAADAPESKSKNEKAGTDAEPAHGFALSPFHARAQPKILDFGVARAADPDHGQAATMQTGIGQLVGTLPYMSPEQVAGDPAEVDTRSDVYALGVLLFELLTGRLPYHVSGRSAHEAARLIKDTPVPRLSSVDRQLRGEIEVIVGMALDKDKSRRYQSAAELGDDLRRFLAGEPLAAKRDSALYVLRKSLRRYRGAIAAAGVFALLLIAFGVYASVQAERNRRIAASELDARRAAEKDRADAQAARNDALASRARLADELRISNVERGRLAGRTGALGMAEDLLWHEHLIDPSSAYTRWALWELYARRPCLQNLRESASVYKIALSADGRVLAVATSSAFVNLWDVQRGTRIAAIRSGEGYVNALAFHPRRPWLFVVDVDGRLTAWDMTNGGVVYQIVVADDIPRAMAVDPCGTVLATADESGAVRLWEPDSGRPLGGVQLGDDLKALAVSGDGLMLAAGGSKQVISLIDVGEMRVTGELVGHRGSVVALAFSPDGRLLASGNTDRSTRVWNVVGRTLRGILPGTNEAVPALAFSPDGRMLASGGWWQLDLFDAEKLERIDVLFGHRETIKSVAFSADGRILASGSADETVRVWESSPNRAFRRWPAHPRHVEDATISRDGALLATVGEEGAAKLWDVATGELRRVLDPKGKNSIHAAAFSGDGGRLFTGDSSGTLRSWNVASGDCEIEQRQAHGGDVFAIAVSSDGSRLLSAGRDRTIRVWQTPQLALLAENPTPNSVIGCLALSQDHRTLVTAPTSKVLRMWSIEGAHTEAHDVPYPSGAWVAAVRPDGRRVAVAGWDDPVLSIWNTETRQMIANVPAFEQQGTAIAYSRDGALIAAGTVDGLVRLFDGETGQRLATLEGLGARVTALGFTPSGRLIAACRDGAVGAWNLPYYDRHIAGNIERQLSLREGEAAARDAAGPLRDWAREVLARPTDRPPAPPEPSAVIDPRMMAEWDRLPVAGPPGGSD